MNLSIFKRPNTGILCQLALIAGVLWAAWFFQSSSFGYYEDDYSLITKPMHQSWDDVLRRASVTFRAYFMGRPLVIPISAFLSRLAGEFGGTQAAYLIGFIIVLTNALLFYTWLYRLFGTSLAPLVGTLTFVLAPADTTRPFLTHAFALQPALTLGLLGFHAYLGNRRILCYILALGSLLCYETIFPLFVALPWLDPKKEKLSPRQAVLHIGFLALIMGATIGLRIQTGEGRFHSLNLPTAFFASISKVLYGPWFSLKAWAIHFIDFKFSFSPFLFLTMALTFFFTGRSMATDALPRRRFILGGILLVALAYPLDHINNVQTIVGRASRIHFPSVVGYSLLLALFGIEWFHRFNRPGRVLGAGILAWVFGAFIAFGDSVQQQYARSWSYQKDLWTKVVSLCPDIGPGTVVLIDAHGLPRTTEIFSYSWSVPLVLPQLLRPRHGEPAYVSWLPPNWRQESVTEDGNFRILYPNRSTRIVPPQKAILLTKQNGTIVRHSGPLVLKGRSLTLKSFEGTGPLVTGPLFAEMIREPAARDIQSRTP